MITQALRDSGLALREIRAHVTECAQNYRKLTGWIIATLVAGLGGSAAIIVTLLSHH